VCDPNGSFLSIILFVYLALHLCEIFKMFVNIQITDFDRMVGDADDQNGFHNRNEGKLDKYSMILDFLVVYVSMIVFL